MSVTQIKFAKSGEIIEVEVGANLMHSLLESGRPVASSCGGDAVCGKCHIKIIEGASNLSPESDEEKDLKEINEIHKSERISCQTQVLGPITVDASYW